MFVDYSSANNVIRCHFQSDITLFSTTLRLGANNEVATISNGAIASTRITNCQRSKNAVVTIVLKLHISMHDGRNVDKFKDGLENYISDNPSIWDSLVFLRCEDINSDDEYVLYRLGARSRISWQFAARIMADRGRLHQFCVELSKRMQVNFDSPTSRSVLYYGGNLVDGAVKDFKKNLLMDRNNISRGDLGMFGSRSELQRTTSQEVTEATPTPTPRASADDLFLSMVQQSHE
jgi:small-conductance mechanosensitive channel